MVLSSSVLFSKSLFKVKKFTSTVGIINVRRPICLRDNNTAIRRSYRPRQLAILTCSGAVNRAREGSRSECKSN